MSNQDSLILMIQKQTNYDEDTIVEKLRLYNNDPLMVIREYMGILDLPEKEDTSSTNQKIFKSIREMYKSNNTNKPE
jgi:hypothetical protein